MITGGCIHATSSNGRRAKAMDRGRPAPYGRAMLMRDIPGSGLIDDRVALIYDRHVSAPAVLGSA